MAGQKGRSGRPKGQQNKVYHESVRRAAATYYILDRMDMGQIAQVLSVPDSTIRRWKTEERWDDKALPRAMSGRMVAENLLLQIQSILDKARDEQRVLTVSEADSIAKLQSTAEKLNPRLQFRANVMDGIQMLNAYLKKRAPELQPQVAPLLGEFIQNLADQTLA